MFFVLNKVVKQCAFMAFIAGIAFAVGCSDSEEKAEVESSTTSTDAPSDAPADTSSDASSVASSTSATPVVDSVNIGIIFGFTGPIESLTPDMAASAELAMQEASESGLFLDGVTVNPKRADSTCVDAAVATAAAERLVTVEKVVAIVGADCSGVTTAVANNVAIPQGITIISPSATSPALSSINDNGLFFRTAPSDARQGQVLAEVIQDRGIEDVAITYTNNDYGKGLTESFANAFKAMGGKVVITSPHEDGKGDYSAEVGALSAAGSSNLVVFGYADQGGKGIVQAALDTQAFDAFIFADGMIAQSLVDSVGWELDGTVGTAPGGSNAESEGFKAYAADNGVDGDGVFRGESYDAAALLILAMQASGSTDKNGVAAQLNRVANAPGTKIGVGELAEGLRLLSQGEEIDYVGATNVEFNEIGEVFGSYKELQVRDGKFDTIQIR